MQSPHRDDGRDVPVHHGNRVKTFIIASLALLMACCVIGCQNHRGKSDELKPTNHYVLFGDVIKEGRFELPSTSHLTVSQAILKSNGVARLAYGKKVKVVRRMPNHQLETIWVDVEAILRGDRQKEDPVLQPGDVIIVEDPWHLFKSSHR